MSTPFDQLPALEIIRCAIQGTPFENDVFLVGGAVRDYLLHKPLSDDLDLVTEQSATELANLLFETGASTIPPTIFETFGTSMVRIGGTQVELVTARSESYDRDSRKPMVKRATYLDDALRRDFTCNSLRMSIKTGEIIDTLGTGIQDLNSGLLRTPLDPTITFDDDPLRMMRAVRFKWKLGFELHPDIVVSIPEKHDRLQIVSIERTREELFKMLIGPSPEGALQDLMDFGLWKEIAPEFMPMIGCEQGDYHYLDVWGHTLKVVEALRSDPEFGTDLVSLLAALFHDLGKPPTRFIDANGTTRFFTHEHVGAEMARDVLTRWRLPNDQILQVSRLVKNHMRLGSSEVFTDTAARRLIRDLGDDLDRLLALVLADGKGHKPGLGAVDLGPIRDAIARVQQATPRATLVSPLSGEEIMVITGFLAGKIIGVIKEELTEQVIDGSLGVGDVESAKKYVLEHLDRWSK